MSEREYEPHGSGLLGSPLAPQLGSDPIDIAKMRWDMRRLTIINQEMLGLIMYATIRGQKNTAWLTVLDVIQNWGVSVGGRGRRDIIRMEAVSKGGMANVEAEMRNKPGMFARNLWKRDWESQKREELGV